MNENKVLRNLIEINLRAELFAIANRFGKDASLPASDLLSIQKEAEALTDTILSLVERYYVSNSGNQS